jgi:CheY-like chemotaxis protein
MNILVVDDDDACRDATTLVLQEAGFNVTAAPDYHDALAALEGPGRWDLLVTDIVMPHAVNGFALARMARLRRPHLKVIYVTGHEVPLGEAVGIVLRKPVDATALISAVRSALDTPHGDAR